MLYLHINLAQVRDFQYKFYLGENKNCTNSSVIQSMNNANSRKSDADSNSAVNHLASLLNNTQIQLVNNNILPT